MAPLAWIRRVASEIPELHTIPLFGNAPPFDWGAFSSAMADRFEVSHLSIHSREQMWREAPDIKKGLGTSLLVLPLSVAPLGTVFWIISYEDMNKLTSLLLKPGASNRPLSSEILQEGFYRYLVLEALNAVQGMEPLKDLTLQLSEDEDPFEKSFCIDVQIDIEQKSCWGRLVIPSEFRSAWVSHFSEMQTDYVPGEVARQTMLVIGIKTGSVILSQDEWDQLEEGDCVLLDQGSYDPRKESGIALMMLHSTPIFNVKIKHNQIELVDYAFYYEDNMEDKKPHPKGSAERFPAEEGEVVALKEMPIYVTVEIARVKMTLDQLMHLNPGNALELPVHPDQGVSLTVNGQKVGRGELVYLGEQLGVRIVEIG